jgi:hypothetical protein
LESAACLQTVSFLKAMMDGMEMEMEMEMEMVMAMAMGAKAKAPITTKNTTTEKPKRPSTPPTTNTSVRVPTIASTSTAGSAGARPRTAITQEVPDRAATPRPPRTNTQDFPDGSAIPKPPQIPMTVWLGPGTVHDEPICKKAKPKHNKYPIGVDNMDMNLIIVILSPVRALVANIRPDNIKALDPKLYPAPVAKVFNEITKTVKANKADFKPATGYIVYPSKDAEGEVPGCGNDVLIDCQKRLMGLKVPPPPSSGATTRRTTSPRKATKVSRAVCTLTAWAVLPGCICSARKEH